MTTLSSSLIVEYTERGILSWESTTCFSRNQLVSLVIEWNLAI
jgi:hypothetical protein